MAYLSLKYCEKSFKTYEGNLGHLTMSHKSKQITPNPEDLRPFLHLTGIQIFKILVKC